MEQTEQEPRKKKNTDKLEKATAKLFTRKQQRVSTSFRQETVVFKPAAFHVNCDLLFRSGEGGGDST